MIQGTFRNMSSIDMEDAAVSDQLHATINVTMPGGSTLTMDSNKIKATVDTHVDVSYAKKTAQDAVTGKYDIYWEEIPSDLPEELYPSGNPNDYVYVRWYVAGAANGTLTAKWEKFRRIKQSLSNTLIIGRKPI